MFEQEFLHAIIENPDDDGPRLIIADWLDERGDPRAGFIRIQCQLARLPHGDHREKRLRADEDRLTKSARDAFVRSVPEALSPYFVDPGCAIYQRGFLIAVSVRPDHSLERFIQHARELFQFAPIQTIHFSPMLDDWGDIHRDVTDAPTPVDKVRGFLQVPSLTHVRNLEMHSPFEDIDAVGRLLAECPYLGKLSRLFLRRDYNIGSYSCRGTQTLLPSTRELLRERFGHRASW
jgi:uncharacterized protein (TIGR02996 family)